MAVSPALIALADEVARRESVPAELFKGVIETESAWNIRAASPVGAVGLAQVMPGTAREMGWDGVSDLFSPEINLTVGARYLRKMLGTFGGDWSKAAAAYNHGPGVAGPGVNKNWPGVKGKIAKAGGDWERAQAYLPTETRNYWRKVLNNAAVWAGKISRTEAQVRVKAGEVSSAVLDWSKSASGRSSLLILLSVALAGVLVFGGRR